MVPREYFPPEERSRLIPPGPNSSALSSWICPPVLLIKPANENWENANVGSGISLPKGKNDGSDHPVVPFGELCLFHQRSFGC